MVASVEVKPKQRATMKHAKKPTTGSAVGITANWAMAEARLPSMHHTGSEILPFLEVVSTSIMAMKTPMTESTSRSVFIDGSLPIG